MAAPKKKVHVSQEQKAALVDYTSKHPTLSAGKFSSSFTLEDSKKMWADVTATLNAIPGAMKDWKHWRKTWQDMKSAAKGKKASLNAEYRKTGGGPAQSADLSAIDEQVLCVIPSTSIDGLSGTGESSTQFEFMEVSEMVNEEGSEEGEDPYITPYSPVPNTNVASETPISKENLKTRSVAGRRLLNSEKATEGLHRLAQMKYDLKREYYVEKLNLLERQTKAFEKLAEYFVNK